MRRSGRMVALGLVLAGGAACQGLLDDADARPSTNPTAPLSDAGTLSPDAAAVSPDAGCTKSSPSLFPRFVDGGDFIVGAGGRVTASAPPHGADDSFARGTFDYTEPEWAGFRELRLRSNVTFATPATDFTHVLEARFRATVDGSTETVSGFVVQTLNGRYTLGAVLPKGFERPPNPLAAAAADAAVPLVLSIRPTNDTGGVVAVLGAPGEEIKVTGDFLAGLVDARRSGATVELRIEVGIAWVAGDAGQIVSHDGISFEICR